MRPAGKLLLHFTAGDLMAPDPVFLSEKIPLRLAAHVLFQNQISGAPVVDEKGKCIGVLSASDFLRLAGGRKSGSIQEFLARLPEEKVGRFMTRNPVLVKPEFSIRRLARMMIAAHIHRLIVVDEDQRPVGIVSSTNILAAIAYAGREKTSFDQPPAPATGP